MLMRIRDGYVPAAGEMRTFFLNLLMFKKQLMATPSEQILLTKDDYQLFKMTRTPSNSIKLRICKIFIVTFTCFMLHPAHGHYSNCTEV
jgi:hypothetical protein